MQEYNVLMTESELVDGSTGHAGSDMIVAILMTILTPSRRLA